MQLHAIASLEKKKNYNKNETMRSTFKCVTYTHTKKKRFHSFYSHPCKQKTIFHVQKYLMPQEKTVCIKQN